MCESYTPQPSVTVKHPLNSGNMVREENNGSQVSLPKVPSPVVPPTRRREMLDADPLHIFHDDFESENRTNFSKVPVDSVSLCPKLPIGDQLTGERVILVDNTEEQRPKAYTRS